MGSIIIFDTETTGLLKPDSNNLDEQPSIIEFYGVKFNSNLDFSMMEKLHFMLKPPRPITSDITRITGITNDILDGEPSFAEMFKDLARWFQDSDIMVAHNLGFDRSMLANECLRIDKVLNFPWPMTHQCTVEKSMYLEGRRLNLTALHKYATGMPEIPGAHRAGNDVAALVKCYQWLLKEGKI